MFDDMTDAQLCDAILEWADTEDAFDPGYVESVKAQLEEKGSITESQRRALERIAELWGVFEEEE